MSCIHLISVTPIQTALLVKFGWEVKLNADYYVIQQSRIPGRIGDYCEDVVVYGEDYFWIVRKDEYSERDIEKRLKEEERNLQWYVDWIKDKMGGWEMAAIDNLRVRMILNEIGKYIRQSWSDSMESQDYLRWSKHYSRVKEYFECLKDAEYVPKDSSCFAVGVDENLHWTITIPSMDIRMNLSFDKNGVKND